MKPAVERALAEIRSTFIGHKVDVEPDSDGGAYVRVHDLEIGPNYQPASSWFGFRITFQYPYSDVYPHYCVPGLRRSDSRGLRQGIHLSNTWQKPSGDEPATMISRRSNQLDPSADTAATKLLKVIDWLRSQ
jgi:hypothetical protein